jgi:hypothetical protein
MTYPIVVCLLYLWLLALGRHVEISHLVDLVDRHDRHDLSIFRWGWDFLERCLALSDPFLLSTLRTFVCCPVASNYISIDEEVWQSSITRFQLGNEQHINA